MKKHLTLLALCLMPSLACAFFCPGNFQDIQIGESLDSVLQKCGKPTSQTEVSPESTAAQEWIYNVTVAGQGSLRMSVLLQDNKILNIVANSMSMPSTNICGSPVSVGETSIQLKAACGEPTFINKGAAGDEKPVPLVELLYEGRPPITLIFDHGKLKEKKQGESGPVNFQGSQ